MPDSYKATWVSHSSLSDFIKCPRAYYLKQVYKDPETNHKVQIISPPLALGSAVHEVIEGLSQVPTEKRFQTSLLETYAEVWKKFQGKQGGFTSKDQEHDYFKQGEEMLRRVQKNPGPLKRLAVKIKGDLPQYWLSEEDEIILCGKIDWLEYLPDEDAVHIIDFKTGKREEQSNSLQLPIYHLLVTNTQSRAVSQASYWYLALNDKLTPKELPDLAEAHQQVLAMAKKMRLARKLKRFKCPQGDQGCFACKPFEKILQGEAEKVGVNHYNQDIYILKADSKEGTEDDSIIL